MESHAARCMARWADLRRQSNNRWLNKEDIVWVLSNADKLVIKAKPEAMPPPGSLFIFNRKATRYWRGDGYEFKQKNDSHERLKFNGVPTLGCCYNRTTDGLHRRGYWLLAHKDLVLVHYALIATPIKRKSNQKPLSVARPIEMPRITNHTSKPLSHTTPVPPLFTSDTPIFTAPPPRSLQPSPIPLARIREYAPAWDFPAGGSKILFVLERNSLGDQVIGVFGERKMVSATKVVEGVYSLNAPGWWSCGSRPCEAGGGEVTVYLTNGKLKTEVVPFWYRPAMSGISTGIRESKEVQYSEPKEDDVSASLGRAFSKITLEDMGINTSDIENGPVPDEVFDHAANRIQKQFRLWLNRRHDAAKKLQKVTRGMLVRRNLKRSHNAAVTIQSQFRTNRVRREFQKLKSATILVQNSFRAKRNRQRSPRTEASKSLSPSPSPRVPSPRAPQHREHSLALAPSLRAPQHRSDPQPQAPRPQPEHIAFANGCMTTSPTDPPFLRGMEGLGLGIRPMTRSDSPEEVKRRLAGQERPESTEKRRISFPEVDSVTMQAFNEATVGMPTQEKRDSLELEVKAPWLRRKANIDLSLAAEGSVSSMLTPSMKPDLTITPESLDTPGYMEVGQLFRSSGQSLESSRASPRRPSLPGVAHD